jgi:competence protein ComEC
MNITSWIKTSFLEDKECWILWIPVFFGMGIIFYFSTSNFNFSSSNYSYLAPSLLFFFALFLSFLLKEQLKFLITIFIAIFLSGFLWAKLYSQTIAYTPQIKHKLYATAIGKIEDIKIFYNPTSKRKSYQITLKDVSIYKAGTLKGDTKHQEKSKKKVAKLLPKKAFDSSQIFLNKKDKINKTKINNYLNLEDYQEIDRWFLSPNYKAQEKNWQENKYKNPPKKIIFSINISKHINEHTKLGGANIGDIIQSRIFFDPFKKPDFPGGYNSGFINYFKGIGARGYGVSNLKVLEKSTKSNFLEKIKILRQKITAKILNQMNNEAGGIAVALLVGDKNFINKDILQNVRSSGLAHLLAISGLHFTLAAGIFFFSIRFLLSLNQYLTLHYNIKKIAAIIAIFGGLFYLFIAGVPIPALRAFIIISLIFIAIAIDLRPNPFRCAAFAALAILILSPDAILSASFQLSFAAVLSLIVLADSTKKYHINSSSRPFYLKFFLYFIGVALSSIIATISTTPFSIYYFNQYINYGFLANLIAIPITTFITMPCGFLAILLMPLGIEKLALYPMQISIGWIVDVANFTSALPYSNLTLKTFSIGSFSLIIFGGLWFCLWRQSWRFLAIFPIILGVYFAYKTPIPNLLIDSQKKIFAIWDGKNLIFSKQTKSRKSTIWAKKLGLSEFRNINELSSEEKEVLQINYNKNYYQFLLNNRKILVLTGRNKINKICQEEYHFIINVSNKYKIPDCAKANTLIDNLDLEKNGDYFLYF